MKPIDNSMSNRLKLLLDVWQAKRLGKPAIKERQQARIADIVTFARQNSPYYKELYNGLPDTIKDVSVLPITSKKKLMERFDDWCTDRDIELSEVQELVKDPNLIGKSF